ncbi:hypothetical protein DFH09DRAFT_1369831 [Mycena vulgaris]|nr:hypothetical protein DFH09DRAFT_1369831 [Mycena vulgaris]
MNRLDRHEPQSLGLTVTLSVDLLLLGIFCRFRDLFDTERRKPMSLLILNAIRGRRMIITRIVDSDWSLPVPYGSTWPLHPSTIPTVILRGASLRHILRRYLRLRPDLGLNPGWSRATLQYCHPTGIQMRSAGSRRNWRRSRTWLRLRAADLCCASASSSRAPGSQGTSAAGLAARCVPGGRPRAPCSTSWYSPRAPSSAAKTRNTAQQTQHRRALGSLCSPQAHA